MAYWFRGKELKINGCCLNFNGNTLCVSGERYDFHNSTKEHFSGTGDLCHGYSFSSIADYICKCCNSIGTEYLWILSAALFPTRENIDYVFAKLNNEYYTNKINVASNFLDNQALINILDTNNDKLMNNHDAETAAEIICEIQKRAQYTYLYSVNALLYVFNNAISNLRKGNSSWNRSLGSAYDPISSVTEYKNREKFFVINNPMDIYRLSILCSLDVFTEPTFWFYTARTPSGDNILYSSNISGGFLSVKKLVHSPYKVALKNLNGELCEISF